MKLPKSKRRQRVTSCMQPQEAQMPFAPSRFQRGKRTVHLILLKGSPDAQEVEVKAITADRRERFNEVRLNQVGRMILTRCSLNLVSPLLNQDDLVGTSHAPSPKGGLRGEVNRQARVAGCLHQLLRRFLREPSIRCRQGEPPRRELLIRSTKQVLVHRVTK